MKEEKKKVLKPSQMYIVAVLLAFAGGFFDAYTYFQRGGVFANAQTGNIIKLSIVVAQGEFHKAMGFLIPILSFILGTFVTLAIHTVLHQRNLSHIRKTTLAVEMILCAAVAFVPEGENYNIVANTIVSFICAMQMQCFQKFEGLILATTVGTGNLRKWVEYSYRAIFRHEPEKLRSAALTLGALLCFMFGVAAGVWLSEIGGRYAILFNLLPLGGSFAWIRYKQVQNRKLGVEYQS